MLLGIKEALKDRKQIEMRPERAPVGVCRSFVFWDYTGGGMLQKCNGAVTIWAEEITCCYFVLSQLPFPFCISKTSSGIG